MTTATMVIGSSPWGEDCAQTLDPNYGVKAYKECRAYKAQLERCYTEAFGPLPEGVKLVLVENPYECPYGAYVTVNAEFDEDSDAAVDAAYWFEANGPETWDAMARTELGLEEPA